MNTEFTYKNLPAVGLICEVQLDDGHGWTECEILTHYDPCRDGDLVAVFAYKTRGGRSVAQRVGPCFRPMKTAKQLARDKAIRDMSEQMAGYKGVEEANERMVLLSTYLHDQGYRKFEIVEEDV